MTAAGILLLGLLALAAPAGAETWDLAEDFVLDSNTQGNTWQYYQITDGIRDGSYDLLPAKRRAYHSRNGLDGWDGGANGFDASTAFPLVLKNTTDSSIDLWGPNQGTVPAGAVVVHPWADTADKEGGTPTHVAIGFKSPITAVISIRGNLRIAPDSRTGNGVEWFLDLGDSSRNLASGTLGAAGGNTELSNLELSGVAVEADDMLFLIIGARGEVSIDATLVSLEIRGAALTVAQVRARAISKIPFAQPAIPREPSEPETRDLTPQEADAVLQRDWLFQADGKPTHQRVRDEIAWARQLATRLAHTPNPPDLSAELKQLAELEDRLSDEAPSAAEPVLADAELYYAVRRVKRRIALKNPVIDFSQVLLIDNPYPEGMQWWHQSRHRNGMMAVPGGRLLVLDGLHPGGHVRKLGGEAPGSFWRPDLSFDGRRVLFCYKAHHQKSFHLYEINLDGSSLRQLTSGDYDDLDPIYLPDGHIMFATTRANTYIRCFPCTYSYILARCDADGDNVYLLSHNNEPDWCPSLLHDGRVIYSRWEYHDKALWRIMSLWTTNPDGTNTSAFWGNQSVWPDHLAQPRAIPGSNRVMFVGSAHHDWFAGPIGIIDPDKGFNFPHGLTKVTPDVPWPECGKPPSDPHETDDYHLSGKYAAYHSPYPLSEEDFLVSARAGDLSSRVAVPPKFKLYLMDVYGNRELIYEGHYNVLHAMPVAPRHVPLQRPDHVAWPGTGEDRKPAEPGVFYSADIYQGVPDLPRGSVKYLRVIQMDPRTYSTWSVKGRFSGPAVSVVQDDGVKRFLGTAPVHDDGSVAFKVPAGAALHFQLLDERYRALHTMRSFTGVMPGERRGCVGCHESHSTTPQVGARLDLRRQPSELTPPPWGTKSISYEQLVQPVLDRYCGDCHQGDGEARKDFDLTLRPGRGPFTEPYLSLVGYTDYNNVGMPKGPPGIAGAMLAENFPQSDPASYKTFRPMKYLSYTSRLIEMASDGKHYEVKVDPLSLRQLIGWVDANCPLLGEDEVRAIADCDFPGIEALPIRPRTKTAPVIKRP